MRILAIDTALGACTAAVVDTGDDGAPPRIFSEAMARGHAETLMPLVRDALAAAGGIGTIGRIVVTVGPGSFTGLRVGLACARAMAFGARIPIVGVTTLEALAAPAVQTSGGSPVIAAIDARHGRVFVQAFGPSGTPLAPARLVSAEEAAQAAGDDGGLAVGSGADAVIAAAASGLLRKADGPHHAPDPIWLARLGAACDPQSAPPRALYLKAADAHPQTNGRIARR